VVSPNKGAKPRKQVQIAVLNSAGEERERLVENDHVLSEPLQDLCCPSLGSDSVRQILSVALALDPALFKQAFQNCGRFGKGLRSFYGSVATRLG
jgi:hypothetical protein